MAVDGMTLQENELRVTRRASTLPPSLVTLWHIVVIALSHIQFGMYQVLVKDLSIFARSACACSATHKAIYARAA